MLDWHRISAEFRENIEKEYEIIQTPEERNSIPDSWTFKKISEIAEVVGGGTPSTKKSVYWNGDIPWLTPKDLSGEHSRYVARGERNITRSGLNNSSARLVPPKTVLLTSRAPVGYVAMAKTPMATNQGFRSIIVNDEHDPDFIYYLLVHNTGYLKQHASGSTFQELSGSTLKSLEFLVPPHQEQRTIAYILGSLDDKIELNRRMNKTLEAMARAIFKSWFVDFDPVRAKAEGRDPGLPNEIAALFPNSFVDSELGEIPKGWEVGTIGGIANQIKEVVKTEDMKASEPYIALEHMPRRSIALCAWTASTGVTSGKFRFRKGNILFGKLRPYFHKVGIAAINGVCSTDIVVVVPSHEHWFGILLGHISSDDFVAYANAASTGTKMPRTNWEYMSRYKFAIPQKEIAYAYLLQIRPILQNLHANIYESNTLIALRDTLLPKLISGELRIPDTEKLVNQIISVSGQVGK